MLEERIARLIAVGASVTANCQPCLRTNIRKALEAGADEGQVAQAITIGKLVRTGATSGMDTMISELAAAAAGSDAEASCVCGGETSQAIQLEGVEHE